MEQSPWTMQSSKSHVVFAATRPISALAPPRLPLGWHTDSERTQTPGGRLSWNFGSPLLISCPKGGHFAAEFKCGIQIMSGGRGGTHHSSLQWLGRCAKYICGTFYIPLTMEGFRRQGKPGCYVLSDQHSQILASAFHALTVLFVVLLASRGVWAAGWTSETDSG